MSSRTLSRNSSLFNHRTHRPTLLSHSSYHCSPRARRPGRRGHENQALVARHVGGASAAIESVQDALNLHLQRHNLARLHLSSQFNAKLDLGFLLPKLELQVLLEVSLEVSPVEQKGLSGSVWRSEALGVVGVLFQPTPNRGSAGDVALQLVLVVGHVGSQLCPKAALPRIHGFVQTRRHIVDVLLHGGFRSAQVLQRVRCRVGHATNAHRHFDNFGSARHSRRFDVVDGVSAAVGELVQIASHAVLAD